MAQIYSMADGQAMTVAINDGIKLTLKPGSGATISYSEVNGAEASAHKGTPSTTTTKLEIAPAWPFYHVSVAGGSAEVAVV